jgi:hypothetical protein
VAVQGQQELESGQIQIADRREVYDEGTFVRRQVRLEAVPLRMDAEDIQVAL